jgi:hypothetical protein
MSPEDFREITAAIQCWYRHVGIAESDHNTNMLCSAALELFNDGRTKAEDLSAGLLELFPTAELVKQNAKSSRSIH